MQQLTYWYLEFEAYKLDDNVYVKEIAILKGDRTQCYTYHINLHAIPVPATTSEKYKWQKSQLALSWSFGEYTFDEAVAKIKERIGEGDLIFISDAYSRMYLEQYFPKVTYQPCEIEFEMNHCPNENCDVRHGDQCARRRVHEMRYADYNEL